MGHRGNRVPGSRTILGQGLNENDQRPPHEHQATTTNAFSVLRRKRIDYNDIAGPWNGRGVVLWLSSICPIAFLHHKEDPKQT